MFHFMVSQAIDADGIYPHPAAVLDHQGGVSVMSLALPPTDTLRTVVRAAFATNTSELIFGMDRVTQPGQGTEFKDVFAAAWFRKGQGWKVGVINYQHAPRIVRPWDWDNAFWISAVTSELMQFGAPQPVTGRF
jgi:hypothetical protein